MKKTFLIYAFICPAIALSFFFGVNCQAQAITGDNFDTGTPGGYILPPWEICTAGDCLDPLYTSAGYLGSVGLDFSKITTITTNNWVAYLNSASSTLPLSEFGSFRIKYLEIATTSARLGDEFRLLDPDSISYKIRLQALNENGYNHLYLTYESSTPNVITSVLLFSDLQLNVWNKFEWQINITNNTIRLNINSSGWSNYFDMLNNTEPATGVWFAENRGGIRTTRFILDDVVVSSNATAGGLTQPTREETCAEIDQSTISGYIECAFRRLFVWTFYPSALSEETFSQANTAFQGAFPFNAYFDLTNAIEDSFASSTFANATINVLPMIRDKTGGGTEFYLMPALASTTMTTAIGSSNNTLFRNSLIYVVWLAVGAFIIIRLSKK